MIYIRKGEEDPIKEFQRALRQLQLEIERNYNEEREKLRRGRKSNRDF